VRPVEEEEQQRNGEGYEEIKPVEVAR
jgi:hypothetical protein